MGIDTDPSKRKGKTCFIGIDPDVDLVGYARLDHGGLKVCRISFFDLIDFFLVLHNLTDLRDKVLIKIEAGWLNSTANYRKGGNPKVREEIARKVGRNHQVGILLAEACERYKLDYELIKPTVTKTTPAMFYKITGIKTKDQEMIDAAMLIVGL